MKAKAKNKKIQNGKKHDVAEVRNALFGLRSAMDKQLAVDHQMKNGVTFKS